MARDLNNPEYLADEFHDIAHAITALLDRFEVTTAYMPVVPGAHHRVADFLSAAKTNMRALANMQENAAAIHRERAA